MNDLEIDTDDLHKRMTGAVNSLKLDFQALRTGRASSSMLDTITVEIYGSSCPLNQWSTINVPDARMVTVNVWDKSNIQIVEKAIVSSGLGINPVVDGNVLRLPIPELNEERRRELAKVAGQYAEQAKIAVRNVRKDGMDKLKKIKSEGISEDDFKLWSDEIQDLTDTAIKDIEQMVLSKQSEIMQV